MRTLTRSALIAFLLAVSASPALASSHHHRHHHRHPRHHRHHPRGRQHVVLRTAPAVKGSTFSPSLDLPSLIAVGNVPGCVQGTLSDPGLYMAQYGASVLRVVIDPKHGQDGQALPCVQTATAEGYRVHLVINWDDRWSTPQIAGYIAHVLDSYAPYAWAVGIGNEQELSWNGITETGAQYAAVWQAVEPMVRRMAPSAILVAGDISPWGLRYLQDALTAGLPGAQALGGHPYARENAFDVAQLLALARWVKLPVWCDEGLSRGPRPWGNDLSLEQMRGAQLAGVWTGGDPAAQPAPAPAGMYG